MTNISRRRLVQLATGAPALALTGTLATAKEADMTEATTLTNLSSGRNDISFKSQGFTLAGHLYTPEGFDASQSYPAVVMSSAFNQVKEQTMAVYGPRLAALGYVALGFDHVGYGDSEGDVRNFENPFTKMESIRDSISFMGTLPFVDRDNLFGLGVCASGGYMALVATTDKRLKAIATVSGMMANQMGFFGRLDREDAVAQLRTLNEERQKFYETGVVEYEDQLRMDLAKDAPKGSAFQEGHDYYMTARAGAETYPNYSHLSPSFRGQLSPLADALSFAPNLYTPYIGIYGENAMADTGPLTVMYHEKASEPKELVEISGASHVSLYDIPEDVDRAITAMDGFFKKHGGADA